MGLSVDYSKYVKKRDETVKKDAGTEVDALSEVDLGIIMEGIRAFSETAKVVSDLVPGNVNTKSTLFAHHYENGATDDGDGNDDVFPEEDELIFEEGEDCYE